MAAVAALGLVLAACGDGSSGATPSLRSYEDVTVYTWWASGVEKQSLDKLAEVFAQEHPDIEFVNDGVMGGGGSATSKDSLQSRLETEDPPDTFVAHAGAELQDYIEDGYIQDVSGLYEEFGLTTAFPEDLIERLSTENGKIYSIPANIHRANLLWANPAVLTKHGIDPSAEYDTIDAFAADLEKLRNAGVKTPLSLGTTWPQVHLLETVLLADLGVEAYNGLWSGSTDWNSPEVTAALEDFETLLGYTNTDRDDLEWDKATERLIKGEAGFNIMGDWAVSAFEAENKKYGEDYVVVPSPGTSGTFDFLADSFVLSTGILDQENAEAWMETVGSKKGQVEFNKIKGSIPARTDIDAGQFTEYQKTAIKSFQEDTIVSSVAHGAAVPIAQLSAISDATAQFTAGATDVATFQAALAASATAD
ncbi:extracellular solute-binding protein [Myceligenerans cantabricum]